MRQARKHLNTSTQPPTLQSPAVLFFSPFSKPSEKASHDSQVLPASTDAWYRSVEKTSQTDDERIKDITVLPPRAP